MEPRRVLHTKSGFWGAMVLLLGLAIAGPPPQADAVEGQFDGLPASMALAGNLSPSAAALAGLPHAEPLEFAPLGPEKAKLINAAIPFTSSVGAFAKPFAFGGDAASRERAVDCLASAMWYEAGNDPRGQRAVGQVVLNRVRHPAFPATVCGVVFQGSERGTGCQFTFTCDGALQRMPSPIAFARARLEARSILDGAVDSEVGLATHYHTDWVHPIWSAALDKIARIDTHLFFRWRGKWGSAGAMMQRYAGTEPAIARLAALSPIHRLALSPEAAKLAMQSGEQPVPSDATALALPRYVPPAPPARSADLFDLVVSPSGNGAAQAMAALDLCGRRDFCKVVGKMAPGATAVDGEAAPREVAFLYVRDRRTGVDRAFWDCATFKRSNPAQCLSGANLGWVGFDGNFSAGDKRPA